MISLNLNLLIFGLTLTFNEFVEKIAPEMKKQAYPYWPPEVYYNLPYQLDYRFIRNQVSKEDSNTAKEKLKKAYKTTDGSEKTIIDQVIDNAEDYISTLNSIPFPTILDQSSIPEILRSKKTHTDLLDEIQTTSILLYAYNHILIKYDIYGLGVTLQDIIKIVKKRVLLHQQTLKI